MTEILSNVYVATQMYRNGLLVGNELTNEVVRGSFNAGKHPLWWTVENIYVSIGFQPYKLFLKTCRGRREGCRN